MKDNTTYYIVERVLEYLYIVSNEDINPFDYYLFNLDNDLPKEIMQCQDSFESDNCNTHPMIKDNCHKIVATNNPVLVDVGVPLIDQKFIESYDGSIVEVELFYGDESFCQDHDIVVIKPKKNSYEDT